MAQRLFILILCWKSIDLFGQSALQKRISINLSSKAVSRDIKELSPNKYALIGMSYDTTSTSIENKLTFITVDSTGNLIDRKGYGSNKFTYVNIAGSTSMFEYFNGAYYSAISVVDSSSRQAGVLLKFNSIGDTIWQRKFYESVNSSVFYMGVWPSVDGNLFILGSVENYVPGYNNHPLSCMYLQKCDSNGQIIWDKKYFASNLDNVVLGSKLVQDPYTKNIVVAGMQTFNNKNFGGIYVLDSIGNLLQNCGQTYPNVGFVDLVQTSDDKFVVVGNIKYPNQVLGMDTYRSLIVKIGINLNPVFNVQYDSVATENTFYRVLELPSGDLLTLGALDVGYKPINSINYLPRLLCTDKEGNFKWAKYYDNYTDLANFDLPLGMDLTANNDVIFTSCNYGLESAPTTFMLYKVNTEKCDEAAVGCNNINSIDEKSLNMRLQLSPQPAKDYCKIEMLNFGEGYRIIIKDIEGRILIECDANSASSIIDVKTLHSGLYIVSIHKRGSIIASTKLIVVK